VRHPDDLAWAVECALRLRHEGVRVFPSAEALLAAEDKWVTALAFRKASIPIPPTRLANDLPDGPFPMILKPRVGWGAENNRVIFSAADPGTTDATSNAFVVQPFIPHERTLIAAVAAGRPIVCIEPTGGGVRPVVRASVVPFPERAVDLATRALAAVDLITGTVDLIETPDGLRVLEVNSAPQLTYPHLPGCDLAGPMVEAVVSERRQGI
jgi:glutathione synthase/RimK-type ligase-like ATP-grasp enzyme